MCGIWTGCSSSRSSPLPVNGKPTELVVTGGKTAIFDAMDRATGKHVFSRDLGLQNIVTAIDPETGEETTNPALEPEPGKTKLLCPNANGARNWPTTAFDPASYMLYVPLVETCADYSWTPRSAAEIAAGGDDIHFARGRARTATVNSAASKRSIWRPARCYGFTASARPWSVRCWRQQAGLSSWGRRTASSAPMTRLPASLLWQNQLNAGPNSSPITYSVQGEQYVAVVAGGGGPTAGSSSLTPEIASPPGGTTLWVFKLPSR